MVAPLPGHQEDPAEAGNALILDRVTKVYATRSPHPVVALDDVSLSLANGEVVALMGPSGCGKSTLLQIAGCLDRPTQGRVVLGCLDVTQAPSHRLHQIRNRMVGFVFQQHRLLPNLSALENVAVPLRYAGMSRRRAADEAGEWLERVGLADRRHHVPSELSGGERQRVAVVRALINRPELVLADEPTGELDSENGEQILDLIAQLNAELGTTFLIATHDSSVAGRADRIIRLRDGRLADAAS